MIQSSPSLPLSTESVRRSSLTGDSREGLEAELVPERGIAITLMDLEGMHARSPAAAAHALALLPAAVWTAVRTLRKLEPLAVLGVGGYASTAGLAAAGMLGVPIVLQEQNSVPGSATYAVCGVRSPASTTACCRGGTCSSRSRSWKQARRGG